MKNLQWFASRWGLGLAALAAVLGMSGCGKSTPDKPSAAAATTNAAVANRTIAPIQEDDLMAPSGPLSEGDRAWAEVMKGLQPPVPPAEWEVNPPSKEALAEFEKKNGELATTLAAKAREFYEKHPKHAKAGEARQTEMSLLGIAAQLGGTNAVARLRVLEEARLNDPNTPEEDRLQLRVEQIQRAALVHQGTNANRALDELEKGVRVLQKEFPKRKDVAGLLASVAQGRADLGQVEQARTLAKEVLDTKPEGELKESVEALFKKLDRLGRPLALKFKAVDGRDVDVQQMKGKVVLVDFWATWCRPCMEALPEVKTTYEKFGAKGFEIVGISFDRTKEALQKITASEKMSWPQFFDESGKSNQFGEEFDITGIPTMWLVDKKGVLRELNAGEDLAKKVEKLLAE